LAEIGDVQRFSSIEKLVAYAGIDASVYQSGEFEAKRMHMSKRGSPYLRYALWQAAHGAIQHDPELQAYYQRKRAEGKHHGTALGAVCRKLLGASMLCSKSNDLTSSINFSPALTPYSRSLADTNSKPQNERIGLVIMQTSIIRVLIIREESTAGLQRFATQKCEACADEEQEGQIRP
jgi:hypothetical protein